MYRYLLIAFVLLSVAACTPKAASNSDPVKLEDDVLVIGDISNDPAEKKEFWQPLADYLETQLADEGISKVEIAVAPDLGTMLLWMKTGKVDLYFDSPYPVLVMSEESGAVPILRRFKGGVGEYHSVFFTRDDSEFNSIEDIEGQKLALEENYSTSGYLLPVAYMIEHNLQPAYKNGVLDVVRGDEIGFVFSGSDDLSVAWVLEGKVAAGVVDNTTFSEIADEEKANLRIIAETENVPRQMAVVRAGLDQNIMDAVYAELLAMSSTNEGTAVLDKIKTTQFDGFPEGVEPALARMKEMYGLLYSIEE